MARSESPLEPHIEYVDVSPDMSGILHTLFVTRSGESVAESVMPAYSAQLFSFVHGAGSIRFDHDKALHRSDSLSITAPMLRAAPMALEGPMLNVGASFTPLGWATFSGLAADKVHDTLLPITSIVAKAEIEPVQAALEKARTGIISEEQYARVIEAMVRQVCAKTKRKIRADHLQLVAAIDAWLEGEFSPTVDQLYASVDLGQRQVQRLCRRYFGVPPAQLVKRYRAIRAAMLLAHEDLSEELRDEVVGAYFDQAHLIHDIRRYTGRTPKGLLQESFAQEMLQPEGHGATGRRLISD